MSTSGEIKAFKPDVWAYALIGVLVTMFFVVFYKAYFSGYQMPALLLLASPLLLLLVYLILFKKEIFVWIFAAVIPFSINFDNIGGGVGLSVPAELMLVLLAGIFIANSLVGRSLSKKILLHPLSIAVYVYFLWMLFTLVFSTMPMVSAKFILMKILFIGGFYFFFADFFQKPERCYKFLFIFLASLSIVILITTYKHSLEGFSFHTKHLVTLPFYANHGIYTTTIAMLIPFAIVMLFRGRAAGFNLVTLLVFLIVGIVLFTGMTFGHSRAAWLSVIVAAGFLGVLLLKIKFSWLFTVMVLLISVAFWYNEQIMMELLRVNARSDEKLLTHTMSSANITSDVSNLERLNRWSCAIKMFHDKPITGFGPGTYMFQYGAYQVPAEKTRISNTHGLLGDAHSEYLKALAESGFMGMITFLAIVFFTFNTGMKVYYREKDPKKKLLALSLLLGLTTYFTHALVNNYLETDKAASLVWVFTAALVALDAFKESKKPLYIDKKITVLSNGRKIKAEEVFSELT